MNLGHGGKGYKIYTVDELIGRYAKELYNGEKEHLADILYMGFLKWLVFNGFMVINEKEIIGTRR